MDIFFFQLAIIFLPGLIWERVDTQFLQKRVPTQFDVLRRTFVFGLVSYLVTFAIADLAGLRFEFVKPSKDELFLGASAVNQVIVTTVAAFICSILWMYAVKLDLLTKLIHLIGASKQFGDEDVWDYTFNARDKNVEYVHVRDFDKKIVYAGWVELFSGTDKVRELVLHDVEVFDFSGNLLFPAPRVYIARPMDNIDVEFPAGPDQDKGFTQDLETAHIQDEETADGLAPEPQDPARHEAHTLGQEHAQEHAGE